MKNRSTEDTNSGTRYLFKNKKCMAKPKESPPIYAGEERGGGGYWVCELSRS